MSDECLHILSSECSNVGHNESWIVIILKTVDLEMHITVCTLTHHCLTCGRELTASCSVNALSHSSAS